MDLLEKFSQKKKKKNFGINQCGKKGWWGVGYYISVGYVDLKNSEPSVPGI
jgi:hypothetical protein